MGVIVMRPYRKEDETKKIIIMIIGIIIVFGESVLIITRFTDSIVLGALLSFSLGVAILVVLQYHFVLKPISKRINAMLQLGLTTLDYRPFEEELKLIEFAYNKNPKKMAFYLSTLFSGFKILDPKSAEQYIAPLKEKMKHTKNELMKANFTIELCYYYLTINDIDMFLLAVKKLKTYHHTSFEKISRKFEKYVDHFNPNEYKELQFIARLYEQGPDDEKIDKLLSHPILYYKMIYTFVLLNYYKSKNMEQKEKEYSRKLNGFEGFVYPLKRTDINEL
jgi:hypothetical protein